MKQRALILSYRYRNSDTFTPKYRISIEILVVKSINKSISIEFSVFKVSLSVSVSIFFIPSIKVSISPYFDPLWFLKFNKNYHFHWFFTQKLGFHANNWYHSWYHPFVTKYQYRYRYRTLPWCSISISIGIEFLALNGISISIGIELLATGSISIGIEKRGIEGLCYGGINNMLGGSL